jgi:hypothetical protein
MSTKLNANLKTVELTQDELNSIVGGTTAQEFARQNDAIAQVQMKASTAMAKQQAIAAMNDALNKSIKNIGTSLKAAAQ